MDKPLMEKNTHHAMKKPSGKIPPKTSGLRHIALFVDDFAETEYFYVALMGMQIEWRPDDNSLYLTSGNDNLALHQKNPAHSASPAQSQRLDHIGFIIERPEEVDLWYDFLTANNVKILNKPKTHRDGARSFYCFDPDGTQVQIIYHPPLSCT